MPSVATPPAPPARLSKAELIEALARELQRERARNASLQKMLDEVEELSKEAAREAAEEENKVIERQVRSINDRLAKADIAQRQRELARLRAELEAAQNVAEDEATHYLSLINNVADGPQRSDRRALPQPSQVRSPSPTGTVEDHLDATQDTPDKPPVLFSPVWTTLEGDAAERAAKRMAIVEAELGIEKNDPTDIAATPAEASTCPTTLSGAGAARLGYHRNRALGQHASDETVESGVKGTDEFGKNSGGGLGENGRWSKVLSGLNHSFRKAW